MVASRDLGDSFRTIYECMHALTRRRPLMDLFRTCSSTLYLIRSTIATYIDGLMRVTVTGQVCELLKAPSVPWIFSWSARFA